MAKPWCAPCPQAWLYTYNLKELWHRQQVLSRRTDFTDLDMDEEFEPHLNSMLRGELLYYTRVSIYMAITEAMKQPTGTTIVVTVCLLHIVLSSDTRVLT